MWCRAPRCCGVTCLTQLWPSILNTLLQNSSHKCIITDCIILCKPQLVKSNLHIPFVLSYWKHTTSLTSSLWLLPLLDNHDNWQVDTSFDFILFIMSILFFWGVYSRLGFACYANSMPNAVNELYNSSRITAWSNLLAFLTFRGNTPKASPCFHWYDHISESNALETGFAWELCGGRMSMLQEAEWWIVPQGV